MNFATITTYLLPSHNFSRGQYTSLTKYTAILSLIIFATIVEAVAQDNMGIGTATPDASALLHLQASDKGLLIPTVATTASITNPATGLLVYYSADNVFLYNAGTPGTPNWLPIAAGSVQTPLVFGNGLTQTGSTIDRDPITHDGDVTGTEAAMVVERIRGNPVEAGVPSVGQFLQWSGTEWTRATVVAGEQPLTFSQGLTRVGNTVTRATISHDGDVTGLETVMVVERIRGNLVEPGVPSVGQFLQWSGTEWTRATIAASEVPLTFSGGLTRAGNSITRDPITHSGDVTGQETAMVVERIRGRNVDAAAPSNGQIMQWSNAANSWTFANVSVGEVPLTFTQGLTRVGNTVTRATISHAGDVTGPETAMVVERIRGRNVDAAAPSNGQIMQWSNAANSWTFANISVGNIYTAGGGLSLVGNEFRLGGTINDAASVTINDVALQFTPTNTGRVEIGSLTAQQSGLRLTGLTTTSASTGQVLSLNGSGDIILVDQAIGGGIYTAGGGLSLVGNEFRLGGTINDAASVTINDVALQFTPTNTGRVEIGSLTAQQSGLRLTGLTTTSASTGQVLSLNGSGDIILVTEGGSGGGEANNGVNLGSGEQLFAGKSGTNLQFRSIFAGGNISISTTATDMTISVSGLPTFGGTPDASNRLLFETGDNTMSSSASLTWNNDNSTLTTERIVVDQTLNVTGATVLHGGARVGNNGTQLAEVIKVTVNADLPSIDPATAHVQSFGVANAQVGSSVIISPADDLADGLNISFARVSGAGTVAVKFYNSTGAAIDPPAMDFFITVIR